MSDSHAMDDLVGDPDPSFEHVLSCVFGVQDHESRTYLALAEQPGSTVAELAEQLNRDRSNVNRSLSTLMDKGLVERRRRLLDPGGTSTSTPRRRFRTRRNCSTTRSTSGSSASTV